MIRTKIVLLVVFCIIIGGVEGRIYYCYNNTDHCTTCQDTYKCLTCDTGYSKDNMQKCCPENCSPCKYTWSFGIHCACGINEYYNGACWPCPSNCTMCDYNNSQIQCVTCNPGYYNDSSLLCPQCPPNCTDCQYNNNISKVQCVTCNPGYYNDSSLLCPQCPIDCSSCQYNLGNSSLSCFNCSDYCQFCQYNFIASLIDCYECQPYFELVNVDPVICEEICGDLIKILYPCDNQKGILFDGCNDTCQIQNGFNCSDLIVNESICSYQLPLKMTIKNVEQKGDSITIRISVYPPLYVFQISDLKSVFLITDPIFTVNSVEFDPSTGEVVMKAGFSADYLNKDLIVEFVPNENVDIRYFASVNSTASYLVDLKHYDDWMITITSLIPFICYAIAILGLVGAVIGLISKRLAGLEAMFVYQIAWLTMVMLNTSLETPFENTNPLRYATGYHQPLFGTETPTAKTSEDEYPHLTSFFLDRTIFANNFNIFFVLQVLPLIFSLVFGLIVKVVRNRQTQLKEMKQIQQLQKIKIKHDRFNLVKQASMQCLMFFGSFNLLRFITCSYIFFRYNIDPFSHIPSIVLFCSACFVYLLTLILFYFDPDPFDYFRYAFRKTRIALHFYYIYISAYICTILLVLFLQLYFAPAIPLFFLLIFILIYKPYKEKMENFRSIFNIIVMISWLSMRIFYEFNSQPLMSDEFIFLSVNLLLLLMVIIVSWVALIYNIIYECYLKPNKEKTDEEKVMCELEMVNVKQNMQNIKEEQIIFKKLLTPNMNIIDMSNSAKTQFQHKTFQHQYESTESKKNRKLRKQLQVQKLLKTKKILKQKQYYINQLKQKIEQEQHDPDIPKQKIQKQKMMIYAMQVMVDENSFIRLKNAKDYTQQLMKQQDEDKSNKNFFIDSYNQI